MKKILHSLVIGGAMALLPLVSYAGVDPTTAWFDGEDFESYEVGTVIPAAQGWEKITGADMTVDIKTASQTGGSATGKVLGFATVANSALTEPASGPAFSHKKTFSTLTGVVHIKVSSYSCTRGTFLIFLNSNGEPVFGFGGKDSNAENKSNLFYTQELLTYSGGYLVGATTAINVNAIRGRFYDWDMVLDLTNKKVISVKGSYKTNAGATNTNTVNTISLTNGGDITSLAIVAPAYAVGAMDNVTIGQLIADKIANFAGDAQFQTLSGTQVDKTYSVKALANVASLNLTDLEIPGGNSDITWSVSDWGGLSVADQEKVSLVRRATNHAEAVLTTTDAISADANITLQAVCGATTITKEVALKAVSVAGLKEGLATEITTAGALVTGVTDSNPYLTGIIGTLNTAIVNAQGVYENPLVTVDDVAAAISTLQAAELAFSTALSPYTDFVAYIATVQAANDAETRTAAFFTAIKSDLGSAIAAATAARTTVTSEIDITSAESALQTALTTFNEAIPSYDNLSTSITTVTTSYTAANARVGTKFLNYSAATVATLNDAITAANNILSTGTTTTALDNAKTTVEAALATFNTTGRIAPESTPIVYKIYTYGNDGGDGNTSNKQILYANGAALNYVSVSSATGSENDKWEIAEVSPNVFTIKNAITGDYIARSGDLPAMAATPTNLTLPEAKSQTGLIEVESGFYLYGILDGTRALEVDPSPDFYWRNGIADRLRFAFHFEEYDMTTGISNVNISKAIVSTSYYDLTGKAVTSDAKGFVIKKVTYSDGSVENIKVMIVK